MLRAMLHALLGTVLLFTSLVFTGTGSASAAALVEVTEFGDNPSGLGMHVYVPDNVADKPALVVAAHYCTGSGPVLHQGSEFGTMADRYGFVVVYPSATRPGHCFDSSSPEALSRNGGSDPVGVRSMVRHAIEEYDVDPKRVFVVGVSSGAMLANVLLAHYPDVFAAGSAFMGVPYTCFASPWGWNSDCSGGRTVKTPQEWGDLVRAAYPGYRGKRPRMQLWHGADDNAVSYVNLGEQVKQWTDVHRVGQVPAATDNPQPAWTRSRYGGAGTAAKVESVSLQGIGHWLPLPGMAQYAMEFFGLSVPCRVSYRTDAWEHGLTAYITVANRGAFPVKDWRLSFTLPTGQRITSGWNAVYSGASGPVTARPAGYNAVIEDGDSIRLGLVASHTGDRSKPTAFTLNGTNCEVI
ncbi:extracellular catalytic domain type 1 short-chain-length polyhydroxyalkanoate depolymerase [Sinosporangium siamense]|uniref:CBM2 domain-containing protein n=1 Tax=Sinosporangium siamense TaxID=1367973 RepID=A0A919RCE9_9ACTN|nr:PHB depolymerase family esterase [Sinosporangium siamense]GII91088.1 hypothetical protein Ssi02_13190 [Sinosporangium siamense]